MKATTIRRIATAALLAGAAASVQAQGIRQERLKFKAGTSSATVEATLKGDETVDYLLNAKAGQTMKVSLKSSNGANYFNVLPPGSEAAIANGSVTGNQWSGALPKSGDYRVRVYLMRSAARRNETAKYTLTVAITGAGDAKVAGTQYHATGKVPCSVGTDPKGSAQCSFGVIRRGSGQADVHLASPGFDVTIHKDQLRVLQFRGNNVTSAKAEEKVKVTRQSDNWLINVNDFQYYTIPDAVINGG